LNEQLAVVPRASVAVQTTTVLPSGKTLPEGGAHTTLNGGQLPVTVGGG
jgi:hypothetical protein